MANTLGLFLVNDTLPEKYKIKAGQRLDKSTLKTLLVRIAREEPLLYPDVVVKLKEVGDMLSTHDPYSPGLDDLASPKGTAALLSKIDREVKAAPTRQKKIDALQAGETEARALAMTSEGNLAIQVKSGGRGKPVQLMRMIVSPVASRGTIKGVNPMAIKRSYGHGLAPGEYFAASMEARQNAADSFLQVQQPGAINKTLTSNLNGVIISEEDCGTRNGLMMDVSDPHVIDRYTAEANVNFPRNTLITAAFIQQLIRKKVKTIKARSPMTCASNIGVCSYCQGVLENKQKGEIGTNVGVRAAQAMSEPLVQMALDSKHATKLTSGTGMSGLSGFEQLTKVPKNFLNKAVVSKIDGHVSSIKKAPQGGTFLYVNDQEHYVDPGFRPLVREGDEVEAGDVLTEGVPSPKEIVQYKGLGAGRMHYVNALHQVYRNSGVDLDRRHLENLARSTLNFVKMKRSDPKNDLYAGEVKNYNSIRDTLRESSKEQVLKNAEGAYLADEYLHFTSGTKVTPSVSKELKKAGITKVRVGTTDSAFIPLMHSAEITPLMNPDLLAKMGFRYLKKSFIEGVQKGAKSDLHGTSPWPAYMYGKEFGQGESGKY